MNHVYRLAVALLELKPKCSFCAVIKCLLGFGMSMLASALFELPVLESALGTSVRYWLVLLSTDVLYWLVL